MSVNDSQKEIFFVTETGPITISEESVRKEADEIIAMEKELLERKDRFVKLTAYLVSIGVGGWVPASARQTVVPPPGRTPADVGTWTSEVPRVLQTASDGMSMSELAAALKGKVKGRPEGIYNAIAKMAAKSSVVKHNGKIFAPGVFDEFMERVKRGEIEDAPAERPSISDTMVDFVDQNPNGVEAAEIVKAMKAIGMSPGTVYNNLSKIVAKGRVRREGKLYLPKKNEAPAGEPESASKDIDDEPEELSFLSSGSGND